MSIWSSREHIGFDIDWDAATPPVGGEVRSYATGWSNHYPTTTGDAERPAMVDTAYIPVWCVPGHREETDDVVGPWLRLSVSSSEHDFHAPENVTGPVDAAVVLDESAVRALVASLTEWLEMPKAQPRLPDDTQATS